MEAAAKSVRAGVSEVEVLAEAEYAMLKAGSGGSPFRPRLCRANARCSPSLRHRQKDRGGRDRRHPPGCDLPGLLRKDVPNRAVGEVAPAYHQVHELLLRAQAPRFRL